MSKWMCVHQCRVSVLWDEFIFHIFTQCSLLGIFTALAFECEMVRVCIFACSIEYWQKKNEKTRERKINIYNRRKINTTRSRCAWIWRKPNMNLMQILFCESALSIETERGWYRRPFHWIHIKFHLSHAWRCRLYSSCAHDTVHNTWPRRNWRNVNFGRIRQNVYQ